MALEAMGKKTISGACCESNEEVKVTPPARPKRAKNKLNGNLPQQPVEEDKNSKLNVKEASSNGSLSTDDFQDTKMEPNPSAANSDLKSQISALKNSESREAGNGMSMMSNSMGNKRSFGTSLEYSAADVDRQFSEKKYFEKESKEVAETFNVLRDIQEERRVDFESCVSPDIAGGSQDEESFFSAEETENTSEFISLSSYNLKESLNEGCTNSEGSQVLSSLNAEEINAKDETSTGFNSPAKRDQDISRIQIHSAEDSANHANTTEKVENSCSSDGALSEVSGLLNSRGAVAALSNNSGHNHTSTTAPPGCPPDPDSSGAVGRDFETDTESEEDLSSSTDTSSEGEYDVHLYEHHHGLILVSNVSWSGPV